MLECARILKNIETDVTLIFVLFDAEDAGLLGSEYYSGWAHQRGDSILLMVNMDCVGYYDCNSMAFVEYAIPLTGGLPRARYLGNEPRV